MLLWERESLSLSIARAPFRTAALLPGRARASCAPAPVPGFAVGGVLSRALATSAHERSLLSPSPPRPPQPKTRTQLGCQGAPARRPRRVGRHARRARRGRAARGRGRLHRRRRPDHDRHHAAGEVFFFGVDRAGGGGAFFSSAPLSLTSPRLFSPHATTTTTGPRPGLRAPARRVARRGGQALNYFPFVCRSAPPPRKARAGGRVAGGRPVVARLG